VIVSDIWTKTWFDPLGTAGFIYSTSHNSQDKIIGRHIDFKRKIKNKKT